MAKYRLLVVNHAVEIGGAERALLGFLDCLDRDTFTPALACPHPGPLTGEADRRLVRVHIGFPSPRLLEVKRKSIGKDRLAAAAYPWDLARTACGLAALIRREGYDLVLTNSAKADIYGSMAGKLAGRPVIWRLHDIASGDAFSRLNLFLFRASASLFADRVLAISEVVRRALVDLGVPEAKVGMVHNGILPPRAAAARQEVRAAWGVPAGAPLVGMVGRLVDWKGPDYFIAAAAEVAASLPEARFMLVGDAIFGERSYVDGLKAMARGYGLEGRVIFTGFREDVEEIIAAMDLLVHASVLPEPFGLVIIEAMAQGLPVVATRGGGVGEVVDDGETGLLVPPRDAAAMAEAIRGLLADPARAAKMGKAGKRAVAERFDLRDKVREMEAEMLVVLASKGARR
ncbi:MAG: glycosyltransferase family 4 protein [Actinomycetota bacterium]